MDDIKKYLIHIGLSTYEIDAYFEILEAGNTTILQVSRKLHIPRTTVYLIVQSLINKGLVKELIKRKKRSLISTSPDKLIQIAENEHRKVTNTISILKKEITHLNALYNANIEKPKVYYFNGEKEVNSFLEEFLRSPFIYFYCLSSKGNKIMGEYLRTYVKEARESTYTKEIIEDTVDNRDYKKRYSTAKNEILCIPEEYVTNVDYIIFANKMAFITYKSDKPVCLVIEDKDIIEFEKTKYIIVWERFKGRIF